MKFASLKRGGRDGTLIVVSADISQAVAVPDIAPTLQKALEDWSACEPRLTEVYDALNTSRALGAFPFREEDCHSPLPRAYQWCEASVFISHLERCRKSTNRDLPQVLYTDIGMYQGGSDSFTPPYAPMVCANDDWDADLEAGVCIITDDVPMGTTVADAAGHIKLLVLVNDFSLRKLQFPEMAKGLGVLQSKPANAYSPIAVSPAALGPAWTGTMLARPITVTVRGKVIGEPWADRDALFDFPQIIAHLARTREIEAGSIIGGGTVSNKDDAAGYACLLEKRAAEILAEGQARTSFLKFGDRIRIESFDVGGRSIFGAIDQVLARIHAP